MPLTFKRIVCLANSRMSGGNCVAGKEILIGGRIGGWVRPVGAIEGEGLPPWVRHYSDGNEPQLLDIIEVPVSGAASTGHQQENWSVDDRRRWTKVGQISRRTLTELMDHVDGLWLDGDSTKSGLNDRFSVELARTIKDSLRLVRVAKLDLKVWQPGKDFGDEKRRVFGRIWISGTEYRLSVTDPEIEREYLAQRDGYYSIDDCYLTVSLGKPFQGNIYKLIAAVIRD